MPGDLAEIDVGADGGPGRGQFLIRITALHHQRHPLADLLVVFGILHGLEQRAGLQRLVALFKEADIVVTPDEAHVRGGVDE
ncbi:hypothetical protein D3C71_2050830 [compost metagenome]